MAFDNKEYAKQLRENAVRDNNGVVLCSSELWEQIASIIENIPTADVVEVKRGEWIVPGGELRVFEGRYVICSECNVMLPIIPELYHRVFCPKCGAKMDGGKAE